MAYALFSMQTHNYLVQSFEKDRAKVSYSIDTIGYLKNEIKRLVLLDNGK